MCENMLKMRKNVQKVVKGGPLQKSEKLRKVKHKRGGSDGRDRGGGSFLGYFGVLITTWNFC